MCVYVCVYVRAHSGNKMLEKCHQKFMNNVFLEKMFSVIV